MSVNKFYPINVKNANNISGTYGSVSLLVNANEETKGTTILKHVGINRDIDNNYNLAVNGNVFMKGQTDISGSLYVNGVQITSSGGGNQDLASVLSYGATASTDIDMAQYKIVNASRIDVSNVYLTTINGQPYTGSTGGTQDLASVLSYGRKASTEIDMSFNNITNVNNIELNMINGVVPNFTVSGLGDVLLVSNKATTYIDMSLNDISGVNNLQVSTINGVVPSFTTTGLGEVLLVSNKASTYIDMSSNDISGVNNLYVNGNTNLTGNLDVCGNAIFNANLDSYGSTYVEKLTFSNISSDVPVINWDASIPTYSSGGEYILYAGSGTSTDISGFTMDAPFDYTAGIISGNFNMNYYTTYYPVASNQAFFFHPTGGTEMTIKSVNYDLPVGEYLFGFYCQSSNTGGNGLTINAYIKNSATNAIIKQQDNINPVASFPNWVFIKIPFVITSAGNHYFEFANLPNYYIFGAYILITGIELTLTNAIIVKDTETGKTATVGGSQSIINQLYINDGVKVNSGGINVIGGMISSTTYGTDNTTLNTILGENSVQAPSQNVAIGTGAMQTADTATTQNVAIGVSNTQFYTNVKNSVSIGYNAQVLSNAERTVVIGSNQTVRGIDSVAIGAFRYAYLGGCISSYCVSVGADSLGGAVSNGYGTLNNEYSTSIGYKSQFYTADKYNTSVGALSFYNLAGTNGVGEGITTQYNTAIGYGAGFQNQYNNCTFLGSQADTDVNGLTNATAVGFQTIVSESNCIQLGSHGEKVKISGDLDGITTINGVPYTGGGGGGNQDLASVLSYGAKASTSIDMSENSITNVNDITTTTINTYTPAYKNVNNGFTVSQSFAGGIGVNAGQNINMASGSGIINQTQSTGSTNVLKASRMLSLNMQGNIDMLYSSVKSNIVNCNDLATVTINSYTPAYKNVNNVFTTTQSFSTIRILGTNQLQMVSGSINQEQTGGQNVLKSTKFYENVDISGNDVLNVNNINLTSINGVPYTGGGPNPNLSTVLGVGNSAGTYSIDMNSQNITGCNNLGVSTINSKTPAYANGTNTFSANNSFTASNTFEGSITIRETNMQSGYTFTQGGSATIQQTGITGTNTLKACSIKGNLDVSGNISITTDKTISYDGDLYFNPNGGGSIIANGATGIGLSNFGINNARGISTITGSQVNLGAGSTMSIGNGSIYECADITVGTVYSTTTMADKMAVNTTNINGSVFDVSGNVYFHDGTMYLTRGGGSLATDGTIRINYLEPITLIEYNFLSEALVPANLSLGAYTPNVNQGIAGQYSNRLGMVSIGKSANQSSTNGASYNTSVGFQAGQGTTSGNNNTNLGYNSGKGITTGSNNVCIGSGTGDNATNSPAMSNCTLVGAGAEVGATSLSYATAIGAGSVVSTSNTVQLGRATDTVNISGKLNISDAFKPVNTYLALSTNVSYATSTSILGKKIVVISNTATPNTITIPNVAVGNGYELTIANTSNTSCIILSNANLTGKFGTGATSITLFQGVTMTMYCNGTNWIIFGYAGTAQQIVYRQTGNLAIPFQTITTPTYNQTDNITWASTLLTQSAGTITNNTGYDLTINVSTTITWNSKANSTAIGDSTTLNATGNRSTWYNVNNQVGTYPKFLGTNNFNTLGTSTTASNTVGQYFQGITYQTFVANFILKNTQNFKPQIFQTNSISNGGSQQVYLVSTSQLDAIATTITIMP